MIPYRIPIRLADGSVLYSEGIGSVRFIPEVNGRQMVPLLDNKLWIIDRENKIEEREGK